MDRLERLQAWESAQAYPFTRRAAVEAGWTDVEIAARLRSGRWHRLTRGAFVLGEIWNRLSDDDKHVCVTAGRLLLLEPGWHAARGSAVITHRLPYLGKAPARPQLVRAPATLTSNASSRHERLASLPQQDRAVARGIHVTSLARTAMDQARVESTRAAVVIADAVLRRGVARAELLEVADRCAAWPGGRATRQVALFADGRAESALESISRVGFHDCGLPMPEPQVEVWRGRHFIARVDFLWEGAHTVGEADGRIKYDSVDDVLAERRRELQLRELGLEVVRWDWDDAFLGGAALAVRVRSALRRGSRLTVDPSVRFVTTSVPVGRAA